MLANDRMKTSIYELLMHGNPQVLADLDSYQRKNYGVGIEVLREEPEPPVSFDYQGEGEDYAEEMRKAPSRSRD